DNDRVAELLTSAHEQASALAKAEEETRRRAESEREHLRKQNSNLECQLASMARALDNYKERLATQEFETEKWHSRYAAVEDERMELARQIRVAGCDELFVVDLSACPLCGEPNLILGLGNSCYCGYCQAVFSVDIDETLL